jgi:DNA-binding GntR family transcriptional regulator
MYTLRNMALSEGRGRGSRRVGEPLYAHRRAPRFRVPKIRHVSFSVDQSAVLGEKTSVAAARLLRAAILSGELPAGQVLGEESLAKQLGISRTPIREALLRLHSDGLVEMPPNRPAAVRSFGPDDLYEMHSLRALLEGHAARVAAARLDDADFAALEASCARYGQLQKEDKDLPKLVDENFAFHTTIIEAAASDRLSAMIRQVSAVPLIYKSYMTYSIENRTTAWKDHLGILEALKARDAAEAEHRMKAHIEWARDVALEHLRLVTEPIAPG